MENLNDLFEIVKRKSFLVSYAKINPEGGINHRFTGRGTNDLDKRTGLTDKDKEEIKAGLVKFVDDVNQVIATL